MQSSNILPVLILDSNSDHGKTAFSFHAPYTWHHYNLMMKIRASYLCLLLFQGANYDVSMPLLDMYL